MEHVPLLRTQHSVNYLLNLARLKQLDLQPSFQRRSVWKPGAKSQLIDSILKNIPIPIIILNEITQPRCRIPVKYVVIDGQQRLRTLISFIEPSLLTDYDQKKDDFKISRSHNPELAGRKFNDLTKKQQNVISSYNFSIDTLSNASDLYVRELFRRLNSTGVKLQPQELRNCNYYGEFKTFAFNWADIHLPLLRSIEVVSQADIDRMKEVELINEISIIITDGMQTTGKAYVDNYYAKYEDEYGAKKSIESRIDSVMGTIEFLHTKGIMPTALKKKSTFVAVAAFIYDSLYGIGSATTTKQHRKSLSGENLERLRKFEEKLNTDIKGTQLAALIREGTTKKNKKVGLVKYIAKL